MKAARFLTPVLAGATLILIFSNALPTVRRKHRLQEEKRRLVMELEEEQKRARRLQAESRALKTDRFYLQRLLIDIWKAKPKGAIRFRPEAPRATD
ncbi:MAG: hypothetical protein ACYSX0_05110 [Planctomycetota bacterium]